MKLRSLMVVLLALLSVGMVGCSKEADEKAEPAAQSTDQGLSGEITFWHSFTQGPRLEVIQKAADQFMAANKGVTIKIETFSWGDFYTKWTTGLASGNVPDMSTAESGQVIEMIDSEAIVPLNDLVDSVGRSRFADVALSEGRVDGNEYSVPLYSHAQVMWYREDLLGQAGLDVPTTWDELYDAAVTLTHGGEYGLSVPAGSNYYMATRFLNFYVQSGGGSLLNDDLSANLTSDLVIDGIKYWKKMFDATSPKDSINYNVLDQATLFYQGKTAFDFNSGFHIGGIKANSPHLIDSIAAAPLPKMNKNDPDYGGETSNIPMVVWQNSKHPEICKAFIEYLYSDEIYIEFLEATPVGMLPALSDVKETDRYNANETVQKFSEEVQIISHAIGLGTAIGYEHAPTLQAGFLTSQGIIENLFQVVFLEENPSDAFIREQAQKAEKQLNALFSTIR